MGVFTSPVSCCVLAHAILLHRPDLEAVVVLFCCSRFPAGARATVYAATAPDAPQLAAATGSYLDAHAEPAHPAEAAGDQQLAAWVWDWSKGLAKLPADWDLQPVA